MKKFLKIITIALIFQDLLFSNFYYFTYLDELIIIILPLIILYYISFKKIEIKLYKSEIMAGLALVLFVMLGLIGNLINQYITLDYAIFSVISTIKGYLTYFFFRIIFKANKVDISYLGFISKILRNSIYILSLLAIANIPLNLFKSEGYRYGIENTALGFSHTTELTFFCIISLTLVLIYNIKINKKSFVLLKYLVCFLIIIAGRTKGMIFLVLLLGGEILSKITKKISIKKLLVVVPIVLIVAFPRIQTQFFGGNDGARGVLYKTAIKIAEDKFPLGSGFGTFGSNISRVNYSPIYFEFGINNVWGLSEENPTFITDTYWGMILGENGALGIIIMCFVVLGIFYPLLRMKYNPNIKTTILIFIMYIIFSSIAEPIFTSNKSSILFLSLALFNTLLSDKEFNN